jgi:hypothetical protein
MPYFSLPNKSTIQALSLLARGRARRDSIHRLTEPATVRPLVAPWDYHYYPLCLN